MTDRGYKIKVTCERNERPYDWSCTNPACTEALPSVDGPDVGNPECPRCGKVMVRAPFAQAVQR
jgi:hypothetical protein